MSKTFLISFILGIGLFLAAAESNSRHHKIKDTHFHTQRNKIHEVASESGKLEYRKDKKWHHKLVHTHNIVMRDQHDLKNHPNKKLKTKTRI